MTTTATTEGNCWVINWNQFTISAWRISAMFSIIQLLIIKKKIYVNLVKTNSWNGVFYFKLRSFGFIFRSIKQHERQHFLTSATHAQLWNPEQTCIAFHWRSTWDALIDGITEVMKKIMKNRWRHDLICISLKNHRLMKR